MLLSPGVGLNLKSYIRVVMPQFWEEIFADKEVPHPTAAEHFPPTMVNRQCLQHFVDVRVLVICFCLKKITIKSYTLRKIIID